MTDTAQSAPAAEDPIAQGLFHITGVRARIQDGTRIFSVRDPNALTQAIGYLKFTAASGYVYFRGQPDIYSAMLPNGLRGRGEPGRNQLAHHLRDYMRQLVGDDCRCKKHDHPLSFGHAHQCHAKLNRTEAKKGSVLSGTYRAALEPLLQHYGIKTRWLDVVDNIWIALWFACHRYRAEGSHAYYLRRSPAQEHHDSKVYIAVLETGPLAPSGVPGYLTGTQSRVVDLRYCVPSHYLRPHAQHGVLLGPPRVGGHDSGELNSLVLAYIEVALSDALAWLGTGAMTSTFVLFPPAARDSGYRRLLESGVVPHESLGTITSYGPGY